MSSNVSAALDELPTQAIQVVRATPVQREARGELVFTEEQEQLIRDSFANGATEQEFQVLMQVAKARRLNPFLRQIHFVKRWSSELKRNVWSAQAAIDGFRSIAEASGKYAGQDEPEYEYDPKLRDDRENPLGILLCRVRVYRKDWERPCVGVVHWDEYVQKNRDGGLSKFWREKPRVMMAKTAESVALRKAFPEELSGLYTPEEMGDAPPEEQRQLPPRKPGSGAATPSEGITPYGAPDEDRNPVPQTSEGNEFFARVLARLQSLEEQTEKCATYEDTQLVRAVLGSADKPTQLIQELSTAVQTRLISGAQHKDLGKLWQAVCRKLLKKEKALRGDAVNAFTDPPDALDDSEPLL